MLHIPHLRIHSYLDSGIFAVGVWCFPGRCDKRRIGIDDGGGKIKNTADRHWVLERARIERDEGGARMGDGCCAAEATKYHKVVSIAELRLHYGCRLKSGGVHEMDIVWLSEWIVGI